MRPNDTDEPEEVEHARMSFGDHLEELRKRIIWALIGLAAATVLCFKFGDHIIEILTTPYCVAMEDLGFDPRMVQLNPIESFIEYFKIALKFALVISAPWVLYQLWKFVASGLYASERRIVRFFAPTSIVLFVVGASFMVTIVLSGLMKFLIGISMWFPLPSHDNFLYKWYRRPATEVAATSQPAAPPLEIPVLTVDPNSPSDGQAWLNPLTRRLNVHHDGETYYQTLQKASSQQFVQPFFSVSEYLGFVVNLALAFGLGFQIPLVVIFLISMRIITAAMMARGRKYVILGVAVLAAILTPSPDVGTMMLLAVPMMVLFEAGLFIGRIIERRKAEEHAAI
ncbi:MAG: twin-arginine translocase subunit TatC [Phycisphaerae bacterium]|nr:twin-arginine translocase subunit TatC [Phycisphaerae bacterium]